MNSGIYTATLIVTDDDGGVGSKTVIVTVNEVEFSPEEQIANILDFFDSSEEEGALEGTGKNPVRANRQLILIRRLLDKASDLIMGGRLKEACKPLQHTIKFIDGLHKPPDFVTGDAAPDMAEMIDNLMTTLECD